MNDRTCSVDGCTRAAKKLAMCGMHYLRVWRTDSTGGAHSYNEDKRTARLDVTCAAGDCKAKPRSLSSPWCETHYYRLRRTGRIDLAGRRTDNAKYRSAHARIERDRGKASTYPCVDCGHEAKHWSYTHADPNELTSDGGQHYSLDPIYYEPRCVACHWAYDQG